MTEIMDAVVAYLKADDGVSALVEDRVYPVELPRDEVGDMPESAVIVRPEGGEIDRGTGPIARPTLTFESTGEKFYQAGQVDQAVYEALKAINRDVVSGKLLHSALPGPSNLGRAAITGWPVVIRTAVVIADSGI